MGSDGELVGWCSGKARPILWCAIVGLYRKQQNGKDVQDLQAGLVGKHRSGLAVFGIIYSGDSDQNRQSAQAVIRSVTLAPDTGQMRRHVVGVAFNQNVEMQADHA